MTGKKRTVLRAMAALAVMVCLLAGTVTTVFAEVVPDSQKTVSPYTNKTYTHNAIHKGDTIVQGIDISQWNVVQDWNAVKNAGVEYVFVRVGGRYQRQSGEMFEDDKYRTNIQGALNAGLQVGVYFFSQATTPAEARDEAQFLIDRIGSYNITLPLVMDLEYGGSTGQSGRLYNAHLTKRQTTDVVLAFCDEVTDAGYKPMLYANKSMLTSDLYASEVAEVAQIWMAHYTTAASYTGAHAGWQYTSSGSVPGISGSVDCNFFYVPTSTSEPVNPTLPETPSIDEDDLADLEEILYFVDGYEEGTTYGEIFKDVEADLEAAGLYIAFCDLEGNFLAEDDVIRTNDMAVIFDDEANIYEVDIFVLRGDVNCDGAISLMDIMNMHQFLKGVKQMEGGVIYAADVNGDENFSLMDIMNMHQHIKGTKPITQQLFG